MRRNGMIYTSFALLAAILLVSLAILPVQTGTDETSSESLRIGQSAFFMSSVMDDLDRSLSMASRRMLTSSTNYVITNNEPLQNPGKNLSSVLVNGTLSGNSLTGMENASMNAWTARVRSIAESSGYALNTSLESESFNSTYLDLKANYTVFARMKDPVSLARFNRTRTATTEVSTVGIEDPMISLRSNGNYVSNFRQCDFDTPAEKQGDGSVFTGTGYGEAVVNPSDVTTVTDEDEKILVVDDIDNYNPSDVNDFAGRVSVQSNSTSGFSAPYVFETGSLETENNETLVIHDGAVWITRFATIFETGCYIPSDEGPDIIDRLENKLVNDDRTGMMTLLDLSELPSDIRREDSAIAYVYFNSSGSYGSIQQIAGVTDEYSWFRLDQDHVDEWSMNELVK